jgi:hypothetical protein
VELFIHLDVIVVIESQAPAFLMLKNVGEICHGSWKLGVARKLMSFYTKRRSTPVGVASQVQRGLIDGRLYNATHFHVQQGAHYAPLSSEAQ